LKIIVIGPLYPFRGGISHHNSSLINSLKNNGHDVLAISYLRQYPKILYPGKDDKEPGGDVFNIDSKNFIDSLNPLTWIKCVKTIQEYKPDKVILHWWTTFWSFFYLFLFFKLRQRNFKIIGIVHNVYPHETKAIDYFLSKVVLKQFNKLIFHSKTEMKKAEIFVPVEKIHQYPHPVYDFLSKETLQKEFAKKKLGIDEKTFVILMFGIIRKYKGLNILLDSFHKLSADSEIKRKTKLVIAGEFWDDINEYKDIISKLNLTEHIKIINEYIQNEDIPVYFSSADLFVAPYISGTQSGAVKLALAYNIPILTTDVIGEENIGYENQWRIVKSNNADAFYFGMKEIIKNDRLKLVNTEKLPTWKHLVELILE